MPLLHVCAGPPLTTQSAASSITVANGSVTCSGEEEQATDEGPVAPWWETWDDVDAPTRKRKHPTSKPSAEDTQEDHGLASLSIQVVHIVCLWATKSSCHTTGWMCM